MKPALNLRVCFLLILLTILTIPVSAQDSAAALQRGYRTGYSDGYMAGYRDSIDSMAKNITRHDDYAKADRSYNKDYGALKDYRDGYQQGFEAGYETGFEKRSFEPTLPENLTKRGTIAAAIPESEPTNGVGNTTTATESAFQQVSSAVIIIPRDTELILELQEDISTEKNREGDKFTAKVVSPTEITGAIIEGRISKIQKPGRIKRRSEMLLSFDRIVLNDARWSNFNAILTEVLPVKGDNVRKVDNEGTAVGKSSIKSDSIKVGAATGTGAVVGAVFGGPVGAAVGAGVGAAFGVGAVVAERGKHIRLNQNQQLRIKTSYEVQIR